MYRSYMTGVLFIVYIRPSFSQLYQIYIIFAILSGAHGLTNPITWRWVLYGKTVWNVLSNTWAYLSWNDILVITFINSIPPGATRDFARCMNSAVMNPSGTWNELEYTSIKIMSYCSAVFFKNWLASWTTNFLLSVSGRPKK